MPKIVDPDDLNQGTEVNFDTTEKTIQLDLAGNLGITGVTLQAVYSFCKEEWKDDTALIKFPFPFIAITAEQMELISGWDWLDTTSKDLVRDGGWALKDTGSTTQEEYMNLTTLGAFDDSNVDNAYYQQSTNGAGVNTVYTGEVNQAIQIWADVYQGDFDYTGYFKIFLREQGKTYDFYDLITEQNLTVLTYKKYALPLSNGTDLKITTTDFIISGSTPYDEMSITYTSGETRTIGASDYVFSILIDGNAGTAEEIYEFVQWSLRQDADIDDGVGFVTGKTAEELLEFVGDTLKTKYTSDGGVFIDDFQAVDTNRITFQDDTDTERTFPYVAAGTINFNTNLTNDTDAYYWVFFTDANSNLFDSVNAIIIEDNSGVELSGSCSGLTTKQFDFDYDGNTQGGRTPGNPADFTAVAIGLNTGQYVTTTGTITQSTANIISYVSSLERNYSNPS